MSVFLQWDDIPDDDQRNEALKRYQDEVKQINSGVEASMDAFQLKQSLIRIYASEPQYNFD